MSSQFPSCHPVFLLVILSETKCSEGSFLASNTIRNRRMFRFAQHDIIYWGFILVFLVET